MNSLASEDILGLLGNTIGVEIIFFSSSSSVLPIQGALIDIGNTFEIYNLKQDKSQTPDIAFRSVVFPQ